ncbi:MAG: gfo/Idh/MocA family oxidoreductase, partial [Planctomycetales bacterium]|nr:gfo/Idh/MocA family oxidoreductase [Planctomycetales bacterium]
VCYTLMQCGSTPVAVCLSNLPKAPGEKDSPRVPGPPSGYVAYCEGGRFEGQRGAGAAFDSDGKKIKEFKGTAGGGSAHQRNFIDAVRNDDPSGLNAPVEIGHYSTSWCNVANIASRLPRGESATTREQVLAAIPGSDAALELLDEMNRLLAPYHTDLLELGGLAKLDPTSERFVGAHSEAANALLRRNDRDGFAVPESFA